MGEIRKRLWSWYRSLLGICRGNTFERERNVCGRVQKLLQIGFQLLAVFFFEVGEFERLETSLGGPHGKQHASFAAYGAIAHVKHYLHLDSLIQRPLEVEQAPSKRKLVQARADFSSAVQSEQRQNGASEFDPWGAPGLVSSCRSGHDFRPTMPLLASGVEITKERDPCAA
jgi:hypothetical protein